VGGTLRVDSRRQAGTEVVLTLPVLQEQAA
jgi:signal transduction histidine kinase